MAEYGRIHTDGSRSGGQPIVIREGRTMKGGVLSQESLPNRPAPPAPNKGTKQMTNERLRQSIEQLTKDCSYCANTGICGWDDTPQFCGECSHGSAALNGWNARVPVYALKVVRDAAIEAAAKALEADAKLCDCAALEANECACGAWDDYKSITSARAVEIVRALQELK